MGDHIPTLPSSEVVDVDYIRSRISELRDTQLSPSGSEELVKEFTLQLQSKISEIVSEFSNVSSLSVENLDEYLEHVRRELSWVEAENATISDETEGYKKTYVEDSNPLESELEELSCSLNMIESQDHAKAKANDIIDCSSCGEVHMNMLNVDRHSNLKILGLGQQIEKTKITLKSLQELLCFSKKFEAVDQIEDTLTGLKVIEFEGNHIRLDLRTYIPNLEGVLCQQKIEEVFEPHEQNHELSIEVVEGTMELKNVEIFPNDVHISEAAETTKSFRQLFGPLPVLDPIYFLEFFVRKVQDRICQCALRRHMVKNANKSRHSFEYSDWDDIIVAHMVGGVDAFIKVPQGWPIQNSALKLLSLKGCSSYSNEISLSFLCKVEEEANSLDKCTRQKLSSFVDAIEEILMQQMHVQLQPPCSTDK